MALNPNADYAEIRCLMMIGRRAKAMAFYTAALGGTIALLKNPDDLDALSALYVTGLFVLISFYYLILQVCFTRHRFDLALAGVQDDTTRHMLRRESNFRRAAYAAFIILACVLILYLGLYNG